MTGEELSRELQRAGIGHIEAAKKLGVNAAQMLAMTTGKVRVPDDVIRKAKALPTFKRPNADRQ